MRMKTLIRWEVNMTECRADSLSLRFIRLKPLHNCSQTDECFSASDVVSLFDWRKQKLVQKVYNKLLFHIDHTLVVMPILYSSKLYFGTSVCNKSIFSDLDFWHDSVLGRNPVAICHHSVAGYTLPNCLCLLCLSKMYNLEDNLHLVYKDIKLHT